MSNGGIVLQNRRRTDSSSPVTLSTFSQREKPRATYIIVAHCVDVILQVTFPIVGQDNSTQFAIAGKVEASVSGENQQTGHIPPANQVLRSQGGIQSTRNANHDIPLEVCSLASYKKPADKPPPKKTASPHKHISNVGAVFSKATAVLD